MRASSLRTAKLRSLDTFIHRLYFCSCSTFAEPVNGCVAEVAEREVKVLRCEAHTHTEPSGARS